ncbi:hypothetical protein PAXRUDRAFT_155133 [Paxillus rubicundulus Ve08.2h10]|uniref:TRP C-terminal domain-containing protein n=1 Tax=Paxillus rubicundulus Ve08.2h10 TaxID=930991 RepID=A0A0D0DCD3_9AGAM|nr:hypothetical protein PAXRUDRAFT_155133 [Paxillus rubicundulus Ve08.2h10]
MTSSASSSGSALSRWCLLSLLLLLCLAPHPSFSQPATLPFDDCFSGDGSRKMTVETVYSQIIDGQTLNITVLGQAASEILGTGTNLATLFTEATTLTINTFNNNSYLCDSIRPPSPLPTLSSPNATYCPIPAGPYALSVSLPFNSKNSLTTMNTQLRALDPSEEEMLCLSVATTPLHPGPLSSPYGHARIVFWATVGLAIAYWLVVGAARITSAWGRGTSRPGPGIWHRVESAGFILASAISGERLATSPALMRFCSPSLRDIMIHTQWCAALAMVAVQWPPFIYPLLSQTSWATLTYNITLTSDSVHWNPLDIQPYNPPSNFADQLSDPSSVLYINTSISNTLFLLPPGTPNGIEAFAWSVGVAPQDLFGICLSIFLAILAGIIVLSFFVWMIDWIFSQKSNVTGLPTSGTFMSTASKVRSPRLSGGSKDVLDTNFDESRSLNAHAHTHPTLRRRWLRPDFSSFHTSVLIGNIVRVLSLFHLPVTIFSAYRLSTGTTGSSIALGALAFALFSFILPVLLFLRLARTPTTKLYDETRTLLALGPLYNHFRPGSQLFSGLLFLSNLVNGVAIGCGQRSGTAQAIVILVSEVVSALITSIWLPWGTGAGMGLISFLFCVARIVIAVLLVILTPTISIGSAAGGWVAYGILIVLCLVYLAFFLILAVKVVEALVRIFGCVGFDRSRRPVDSGLVGALAFLGCCGARSQRGGERRRYRATEVHSPAPRDSYPARDSALYVPPNASFAQQAKVSDVSNHSGQPPSVLRPEHALRPYREDSDDDDESAHIMGAWQPFLGPGNRLSYDRAESSPQTQTSNSGFSRVGGGRAHFDSPYAIAGGKGDGSTLTFPSMERKGSGPAAGSSPKFLSHDGEVPTPTTSVANVARSPVFTNSGLPQGAMLPHMRTKSQTAIIVGEMIAIGAASGSPPECHPLVETGERLGSGLRASGGDTAANNVDASQSKKKHWFNIRRNRRHSDGLILDDVDVEASPASSSQKEAGRSFVVIRDRRPLSSRPETNPVPQSHKPSQSLDDSRTRASSVVVKRSVGS